MTASPPPELQTFLAEIRALVDLGAPEEPPFRRAPGEDTEAWRLRVRRARDAHDEYALEWRRATDAAARARYGTTAAEVLRAGHPARPRPLPAQRLVPVPAAAIATELGSPYTGHPLAATSSVCVSVTEPSTPSGAAVLRLHGGAYWMGGGRVAATLDRLLVQCLAEELGAVVVEVDYRLAPEDPFPAAAIDTLAVMDELRRGTISAAIDPTRLALVGTSSGANTAVVAAFADLRRRSLPPVAALGLLVPSADLSEVPTASTDTAEVSSAGSTDGARDRLIQGYLGPLSPLDPEASPALRTDFAGAPATFAAIARYDEVARGGPALCAGVQRAGGQVELREYEMTHTVAPPRTEAAVVSDLVAFLCTHL